MALKGLRRGTRKRGLAGLAVLAGVAIAGLVAAWGVSPVVPEEISPADVVDLRFPADWNDDGATTGSAEAAESTPPATFALASVSEPRRVEASMLFSPYQTFATPPAAVAAPAPQPSAVPEKIGAPKADTKPDQKVATARSVTPAPERRAAPRPRKDSGALFNDAQLASIKNRLKLTSYQEQYWPPVESALRDIALRTSHAAANKSDLRGSQTRLAEIDPDSDEVQRLKSAAFPLIMSMSDEQKREVRTLAMVMGLQQVASSF